MKQQRNGGQGSTGELRPWRIPAGWLIQIELAWLIAAALLGGYLSGLAANTWEAWAYRVFTGANILGLFVLGNAAGYLIYEEVRMVLSGIYHREKVAEVAEAQAGLKTAESQLKTAEAELIAKQAEFEADRAELEANRAEAEVDRAEAAAAAAVARATAARAEARAARAEAIIAAQPEGEARAAAAARAAERAAVAAWYERQQAAQRAGHPFDEPPPGYDNGGNGGRAAG